jgi:flavin reductase (DIM6/NTAB) family NADH-FMN oxidoreductase RutF
VHATIDYQQSTRDLFRRAMRGVAATVTVVTAAGPDGRRHGMTATAFTPVSMDPPTLLVCVNVQASLHQALLASRRLCVNVLGAEQAHFVRAFSGALKGEDRFSVGRWEADQAGLPYCLDAQSNIFCAVDQATLVATHTVVIARVTGVRSAGHVNPLLYLDGHCATAARLK